MYPLSFSEYYYAWGGDRKKCWRDFYTYGGLPQTLLLRDYKAKKDYLLYLADTVFIADVVERNRVRNRTELDELLRILASSIGKDAIKDIFLSERYSEITLSQLHCFNHNDSLDLRNVITK